MMVRHRFEVIPCEEGGFVVRFPDLPGCLTQIEWDDDVLVVAEEIYDLWCSTAGEMGQKIPKGEF